MNKLKVFVSFLFIFTVQVFSHHAMEYIEMESYSISHNKEFIFHLHYDYMVEDNENPNLDHWEFTPGFSYGISKYIMFDLHTHFAKFGNDHIIDTTVDYSPGGPSPFLEAAAISCIFSLPSFIPVDIGFGCTYEIPFQRSKELLDGQHVFEGNIVINKDFAEHSNACFNIKYGKDGEEKINGWAIGIKTPLSQNPHGIAGGVEFLSDFDMDWSILPGIYFPIGGNNTIFKSGLELGENLESMRVNITLMHRF